MPKKPKTEDPYHSSTTTSNENTLYVSIKQKIQRLFYNLSNKPSASDPQYNLRNSMKRLKSSHKQTKIFVQDSIDKLAKFITLSVEDVMIPRSDIVAVKHNVKLPELNAIIARSVHTRTLVYQESLDNIIGFIHIKDLFKVLSTNQKFKLNAIIRKPIVVAPSMKLTDLLSEMKKKHIHMAVVVDEYGGTDGIVTIEDIIEEIAGRMDDEHDGPSVNDSYKIIDPHTVLSNARVEVEDLEQVLGVKLKTEEDEFDTIGGLVLAKVGNVPLPGTVIKISDEIELEVIEASPRILKQVKLVLKNGSSLPAKTLA